MSTPEELAESAIPDRDGSPFESQGLSGLPLDDEERAAIRQALAKYAAARAKVGPGEHAYTDDSPFALLPRH